MKADMNRYNNNLDTVIDRCLEDSSESDVRSLPMINSDIEEQYQSLQVGKALNAYKASKVSKESLVQEDFTKVLSQLDYSSEKKSKPISLKLIQVAASVIIVVAVGLFLFSQSNQTIEYVTAENQITYIELLDKTSVKLEANSNLSIENEFNTLSRDVQFYGEGVFDVAHNAQKPFIIHSELGEVKVLGTRFQITAKPSSPNFRLYLDEGSVELKFYALPQRTVRVVPGEFVFYNSIKKSVKKFKKPSSIQFNLANNNISFISASLDEVVDFLNVQFNCAINIKNEDLKGMKMSGSYKAHSYHSIIKGFEELVGFNVKELNDNVIEIY